MTRSQRPAIKNTATQNRTGKRRGEGRGGVQLLQMQLMSINDPAIDVSDGEDCYERALARGVQCCVSKYQVSFYWVLDRGGVWLP